VIELRHDIDTERYVLGAVLLSAGRALDLLGDITATDFHRPQHEYLWDLLSRMHAKGDPVDLQPVAARAASEKLKGLDPAYLFDLQAACTSWKNVEWHARRLRDLARLRRLQQAGMEATQIASEAPLESCEDAVEAIRGRVDAASSAAPFGASDADPSFGDLLLEAMERWESPAEATLPTGLYDLDQKLNGGLRAGHLFIVGARPAVGKSVVASVIAHAAVRQGVGTLFASLEMSRPELMDRVVADAASVDLTHLTQRSLTDDDWRKVRKLLGEASDWPLTIDDRAHLNVTMIRAKARDVTRKRAGLGLVVVDYLQLVKPTSDKVNRQEQVASVSRNLKLLARELSVPVVALAQVNRGPEGRADRRPSMSDLRESGAIEADADEIVLLHRDDKESPGEIEFIIEKNRHGRTGTVAMAWAPHYSRVASMARDFG
jgi:replicative DNA helicase